jgi:curved DNA-binding protein CbpA
MAHPRDYYELLGVDPHASKDAIERAHRKRAVVEHRRGVFELERSLRRAEDALRVLTDPELRRRYDEHRLLSQAAFVELPPEEDTERARRQSRRLRELRQDRARDAVRISRDASKANSDDVREMAFEHEIQERTRKRALARRARWEKVVRFGFYASMLGLALYAWLRFH